MASVVHNLYQQSLSATYFDLVKRAWINTHTHKNPTQTNWPQITCKNCSYNSVCDSQWCTIQYNTIWWIYILQSGPLWSRTWGAGNCRMGRGALVMCCRWLEVRCVFLIIFTCIIKSTMHRHHQWTIFNPITQCSIVLRSIECIWLSEEHAQTQLLGYFYFVVFVLLFLLIDFHHFICLFVHCQFACIFFSLPATGFNKLELSWELVPTI